LALALGASRVEIAHVQYYGWALKNRAAVPIAPIRSSAWPSLSRTTKQASSMVQARQGLKAYPNYIGAF
jgi:hypothetical protein